MRNIPFISIDTDNAIVRLYRTRLVKAGIVEEEHVRRLQLDCEALAAAYSDLSRTTFVVEVVK